MCVTVCVRSRARRMQTHMCLGVKIFLPACAGILLFFLFSLNFFLFLNSGNPVKLTY